MVLCEYEFLFPPGNIVCFVHRGENLQSLCARLEVQRERVKVAIR